MADQSPDQFLQALQKSIKTLEEEHQNLTRTHQEVVTKIQEEKTKFDTRWQELYNILNVNAQMLATLGAIADGFDVNNRRKEVENYDISQATKGVLDRCKGTDKEVDEIQVKLDGVEKLCLAVLEILQKRK